MIGAKMKYVVFDGYKGEQIIIFPKISLGCGSNAPPSKHWFTALKITVRSCSQ